MGQSASFTPRPATMGAIRTGVKQYINCGLKYIQMSMSRRVLGWGRTQRSEAAIRKIL
jgi:hypothetical protein